MLIVQNGEIHLKKNILLLAKNHVRNKNNREEIISLSCYVTQFSFICYCVAKKQMIMKHFLIDIININKNEPF
jgi:hypothetical protein